MRCVFGHFSYLVRSSVVSFAFLLGAPFAIGAIVIYGLRHSNPSIVKMVFAPWLAILLALIGSTVIFLEGSICVVLASPLFFVMSSLGGLVMGFVLRLSNQGKKTLNAVFLLPIMLTAVEPPVPQQPALLEDRLSIDVAASPRRIWKEILNARDIRSEELPSSFTHWIGVPRPVEGVNVTTAEGEVRYSKWEHGVHCSALVTDRSDDRSITWRYRFTPDSFPPGSLDEHVKIGGQDFALIDTTFNIQPISPHSSSLEIISHYQFINNLDFYAVPVARFIANDFMSTILHLYKSRSERSPG